MEFILTVIFIFLIIYSLGIISKVTSSIQKIIINKLDNNTSCPIVNSLVLGNTAARFLHVKPKSFNVEIIPVENIRQHFTNAKLCYIHTLHSEGANNTKNWWMFLQAVLLQQESPRNRKKELVHQFPTKSSLNY